MKRKPNSLHEAVTIFSDNILLNSDTQELQRVGWLKQEMKIRKA